MSSKLFDAPSKCGSGQQQWLLGFGDLTTLLLAFFVSAISLSPLNPLLPKQNNVQASNLEPGTTIASSQLRETLTPPGVEPEFKELALYFTALDFENETQTLTVEAQQRLQNAIRLEGYLIQAVHISSCLPQASEKATPGELQGLKSRILNLWRQIIDVEGAKIEPVFEVLGSDCEILIQSDTLSEARIKLKFRRIDNG
jgi:hypothetical protein